MKEYIIEKLEEVKVSIKKFESKVYGIQEISTMVNDNREYDVLRGEKRCLEMMLNLDRRKASDDKIKALQAELKEKAEKASAK